MASNRNRKNGGREEKVDHGMAGVGKGLRDQTRVSNEDEETSGD